MGEPLFLAAFVAGVIEGRSVLGYYQSLRPSGRSTSNDMSLLLPSLLYGSAALPMSMIGESPGPAFLAILPSVQIPDNHLPKERVAPLIPKSHPHRQKDPLLDDKTVTPASAKNTKLSMIDLARKDNRMISARQKKASTLFGSSGLSNPTINSTQPSWTHYAATLDPKHSTLPTQTAESLRRMRLLLFGAGVATWYCKNYLLDTQQAGETDFKKSFDTHKKGHTTLPISSSINSATNGKASGGMALRFIHDTNKIQSSITEYTNHGRLPVVLPSSSSSISSVSASCLNLENFEKNYDASWLHYRKTNDEQNGKPFWLVEVDVSPPLREMFGSSSKVNTSSSSSWMDAFLFAAEYIAECRVNNDNEFDTDVFAIVIGSGKTTKYEIAARGNNIIYLDILNELASNLRQAVGRLHPPSPVDDEDGIGTTTDTNKEEASTEQQTTQNKDEVSKQSSNAILENTVIPERDSDDGVPEDVFQYIGVGIRKTLQHATISVTQQLAASREKKRRILHVVSDNPAFVDWARKVLADYTVVWTNSDRIMDFQDEMDKELVALVCCASDEKSSRVMQRILAHDKAAKAVVIMDRLWTQKMTLERLSRLAPNHETEILSLESLNMDAFKRVQNLLVSGKHLDSVGCISTEP